MRCRRAAAAAARHRRPSWPACCSCSGTRPPVSLPHPPRPSSGSSAFGDSRRRRCCCRCRRGMLQAALLRYTVTDPAASRHSQGSKSIVCHGPPAARVPSPPACRAQCLLPAQPVRARPGVRRGPRPLAGALGGVPGAGGRCPRGAAGRCTQQPCAAASLGGLVLGCEGA